MASAIDRIDSPRGAGGHRHGRGAPGSTRLHVAMAVFLTLSLQAVPAAHAATAKEALKCGLAQRKLQLQLVVLVAQALVTLCRSPRNFLPCGEDNGQGE